MPSVYSTSSSQSFPYTLLSLFFSFFTGSRLHHWDRRKDEQLKPGRASRSFHLIPTPAFSYQVLAWRTAMVERADVWRQLGALAMRPKSQMCSWLIRYPRLHVE